MPMAKSASGEMQEELPAGSLRIIDLHKHQLRSTEVGNSRISSGGRSNLSGRPCNCSSEAKGLGRTKAKKEENMRLKVLVLWRTSTKVE
jgi:hypothetical protein